MSPRGPGPLFRLSWILLAVVAGTLVLGGAYLLYAPTDTFTSLTGESWQQFSSAQPDAAGYTVLISRLLAIGAVGFGILALFVTWFGVRDRSPLAINVMWTLPLLIAGLAFAFVLDDRTTVGALLGVPAVILALALVIARRRA
jgi:hypothetical protein